VCSNPPHTTHTHTHTYVHREREREREREEGGRKKEVCIRCCGNREDCNLTLLGEDWKRVPWFITEGRILPSKLHR
jgi:hypothetical protein